MKAGQVFREYLSGEPARVIRPFEAAVCGNNGLRFTEHDIHLFGTYHDLTGIPPLLYNATIAVPDELFLHEPYLRVQVFPDQAADAALGPSRNAVRWIRNADHHALTRAKRRPDPALRAWLTAHGQPLDELAELPAAQRQRLLASLGVLALTDKLWIHGKYGGCMFAGTIEEFLDLYVLSYEQELEIQETVAAGFLREQAYGTDRMHAPVGAMLDGELRYFSGEDEEEPDPTRTC